MFLVGANPKTLLGWILDLGVQHLQDAREVFIIPNTRKSPGFDDMASEIGENYAPHPWIFVRLSVNGKNDIIVYAPDSYDLLVVGPRRKVGFFNSLH